MIRLALKYGDIRCRGVGDWVVTHPSNGGIIAYCGTEEECNKVSEELTKLYVRLKKRR